MTTWLNVPTPDGNIAVIDEAAESIRRRVQDMSSHRDQLANGVRSSTADWVGTSASAFAVQQASVERALTEIISSHQHASDLLTRYSQEWRTAHAASTQAHHQIQRAIEDFTRNARIGVDGLASHLRDFLNNPVVDAVLDLFPPVENALRTITNWHAPRFNPATLLCTEPPNLLDAGAILGQLRGAVGTGLSIVVDAAKAVAHIVGGAIHALINTVKNVERALANAVSAALSMAWNALKHLWEFGKKVAQTVAQAAIDLAKAGYHFLTEVVEAGIDFAKGVFNFMVGVVHFTAQLALTAAGLWMALMKTSNFMLWDHPRMANANKANADAEKNFRDHRDVQRQVDERMQLADAAYDDTGAPAGWERVDSTSGPDGFYAATFRNTKTGEIVVAFRGSEKKADDWAQNAQNAGGLPTSQGAQAIAYAKAMQSSYGNSVVFTGHSLGGSLASMASIATGGLTATTFNAEGIGEGNYAMAVAAGGTGGTSEMQITNYSTTYDILTNLEKGSHVIPPAGAQVTLASTTSNMIDAHGMDAFDWSQYAPSEQRMIDHPEILHHDHGVLSAPRTNDSAIA